MLHLGAIKPRPTQGSPDEADETQYAQLGYDMGKLGGILQQHIQQMPDAYEVVVSLHGVPAVGEAMFVMVALVPFNQNTFLDSLAMAGSQVAPFMDVTPVQGLAGEPYMPVVICDNLSSLRINPFPALLADNHMNGLPFPAVLSVAVFDIIHPGETLPYISPRYVKMLIIVQKLL